jgi:hypothetical protein
MVAEIAPVSTITWINNNSSSNSNLILLMTSVAAQWLLSTVMKMMKVKMVIRYCDHNIIFNIVMFVIL